MKRSCIAIVLGSSMLFAGCGGKASEPPPAAPEVPPAPAAEPAPAAAPTAEAPAAPAAAPAEPTPAPAPPRTIEVKLEPKSNSKLTGTATLTETDGGVRVVLNVQGISPGDHGAHVHEKGDCSAPDGASAGGHFNPAGHQHGLPVVEQRHLGDLGNIAIGKDGKGTQDITVPGANLKPGDPNSYVGRAIIVHEKKDDGGQPTGNSGGRIGCGVISG
jgi:Cu-Zn family superoxide dismutase